VFDFQELVIALQWAESGSYSKSLDERLSHRRMAVQLHASSRSRVFLAGVPIPWERAIPSGTWAAGVELSFMLWSFPPTFERSLHQHPLRKVRTCVGKRRESTAVKALWSALISKVVEIQHKVVTAHRASPDQSHTLRPAATPPDPLAAPSRRRHITPRTRSMLTSRARHRSSARPAELRP
jgi:hypothetical protein